MAGNRNTPRSASVSKQTTPGSKGVRVGVNKGATLPGNKTQSTAQKMQYGGITKKKR